MFTFICPQTNSLLHIKVNEVIYLLNCLKFYQLYQIYTVYYIYFNQNITELNMYAEGRVHPVKLLAASMQLLYKSQRPFWLRDINDSSMSAHLHSH